MYTSVTYGVYLAISVAITVWVARTLFRNGRIFLVDAFGGNTELADSVNHLLVVGFYLLNIGYVTTVLRFGAKPNDWVEAIEYTSTKVGMVLLVLGAMHFLNLYAFSKARKRGMSGQKKRKSRMDDYYGPDLDPPKPVASGVDLVGAVKEIEPNDDAGTRLP
ncbi:MAG: hypothetical protein DHS20C16_14300 [Phycisphaerae bacterium]|nr:MAG: hypothetical protein DHS20C16_14300 [Phycisphaerae bacterium]